MIRPRFHTSRFFRASAAAWLVILAAWLVPAQTVLGSDPLQATATRVSGQVELVDDGDNRIPVRAGQRLNPGQVLECGPDSAATLTLSDGSSVQISSETRIEISDILSVEQDDSFSLSLFFGRIEMALKKLRGSEIVVTPTSIAGVRGTEFSVGVTEDGGSVITVSTGAVEVASETDGRAAGQVKLKPGQEVEIEEAGASLVPRTARLTTDQAWREYRKQKFEKSIPRLPQITGRMERSIDPLLSALAKTRDAMLKKINRLKAAWQKIESNKRIPRKKQAEIAEWFRSELESLKELNRRFRNQITRLSSIFAQAERIGQILTQIKDRLGPDFETAARNIQKIKARGPRVRTETRAMIKGLRDAFHPMKSILSKIRQRSG